MVGTNWADYVMDEGKDVIVFYHATFCNACKGFAEVWKELASHVSLVKDLTVAHMDGSENEVEGLEFKLHGSFPCVRLYPREDKTKVSQFIFDVDQDGQVDERSLKDVREFLTEHSAVFRDAKESGLLFY